MTEQDQYWQQFDESFFKDGYQLCDVYLSLGFTKENLFAAQKQLYKNIDELIDTFLNRTSLEGNPTACKKGCSFCCHQTVLASPYELFYLADFIQNKFRKDPLNVIIERAENKKENTSKLKLNKLLNHKQPCPLLHPSGGFCRAYQARPMACRIYLSSDVKSCKDDLENPNDDTIFPKLYDMPLRAGRMMNEGFQARIRKGRETNLQIFENTIEEGFLTAMNDKAFDKWLNGNNVFRKI
ncbi:MAG: YkgJ family cysteine cluster protein [Prolixibacteraceae bacterium]|jgi:Fe-S-cluster containining protein|nr:YkgJ family cysteine cluster protein [Prolixibacteraceae bacterium]